MSTESERLLKAAGMGNVEAFEKLSGNYMKTVYNIILTSCGKSDDASELTQEVFIKVFKDIKSVKSINSFGTSIYKAVRDISKKIPTAVR